MSSDADRSDAARSKPESSSASMRSEDVPLERWLRFKPNVMPAGAHPVLVSGLAEAARVYRDLGKPCVVTSMCDGRHRWDSFHYTCMAADLRTKNLEDHEKDEAVDALRERLGDAWDVLLEHRGEVNEHIHMEWDKGRSQREAYLSALQEQFYERMGDVLMREEEG